MKLHKLSSLDPIRTKEIRDMVNICTAHDGTSLSFPFEDGELFLLIEEDHRILSSIAFVPVEEKLYDCSAFTHPAFRGQGFFTDLLNAGIEALPEDSELLFYSDKKDRLTAEVLEAIGAEPDSEEHMMLWIRRIFSPLSAVRIFLRLPASHLPHTRISIWSPRILTEHRLCSFILLMHPSVFPSSRPIITSTDLRWRRPAAARDMEQDF